MSRYAKDTGGGEFEQAPVGTHVARCFRLIDLGTQHGEYQGKPITRKQVLVSWELPGESMSDGRPFAVSYFYTNSLNEKATLRHHLEAWRGRSFNETELQGFDLENVLGKPCMVTVTLNDRGKAKVSAVTGLPKGIVCPPAKNDQFSFWIDEWNDACWEKIPKGIQDMIRKSDEYNDKDKPAGDPLRGIAGMDDDIPF